MEKMVDAPGSDARLARITDKMLAAAAVVALVGIAAALLIVR